jgi:hypothetical protein
MENAVAIKPMVYKEARECADRINAGINNVRQDVVALHDLDGWTALGYESWNDCVEQEFKQCRSYIFYQLKAAQIEQNLGKSTKVDSEQIPERQLRPLSKLEPAQQREAWQKAVSTAPEGKVTAAHVSKVVREMSGEQPKPYVLKPHEPIIKQELISEDFQIAYDAMVIELKNAYALKWKETSRAGAIELMRSLLNISENMGR